jgi:hypothetical protein
LPRRPGIPITDQTGLLRELLEITALRHANTNGVTWGGYGAFALLSLGHTSRLIGLKLFVVSRATIGSHPKGIAYLCCTATEHDKRYGRQQTHDCTHHIRKFL